MKKVIVISAINIFEGGPLSIIQDCLKYINNSVISADYRVICLVHLSSLFKGEEFKNIEFVEFPKSRTSYFYRLYYEYIYFRAFAKKLNVFFWLSMHDITSNVGNIQQAVYCHNPSPFNKIRFKDLYLQPVQVLFKLFYKFLYRINIHNNRFIIVQQLWIKENFEKLFDIKSEKIVIAIPQIPDLKQREVKSSKENKPGSQKVFFFPCFPRPFKNIEVICEAVKLLRENISDSFKVVLTISGSENRYANMIVEKYKHIPEIDFVGLLPRDKVYEIYDSCDCLIFPSKLETWGLPLSEFKQYSKSILVANLPYAKETIGSYNKVKFFDPENAVELSDYMRLLISDKLDYDYSNDITYPEPIAKNWEDLFLRLIAQ